MYALLLCLFDIVCRITDDSGFERTPAVQHDHVNLDCEQLDAPEELFGSVMSALAERMAWIQ
jgi:hypothetical protein